MWTRLCYFLYIVSCSAQDSAMRLALPLTFYRRSDRGREFLSLACRYRTESDFKGNTLSIKLHCFLYRDLNSEKNNYNNGLISSLVWREHGSAGIFFKVPDLQLSYMPHEYFHIIYIVMSPAFSKPILSRGSITLRLRKWVLKSDCMSS